MAAQNKKAAPKKEAKAAKAAPEAKIKTEKPAAKAADKAKDVKKPTESKSPEEKKKTSATKKSAKPASLTVTLKRSAIGRPKDQKATLVGMGFKRLHQTVVLKDTPETRGMINKVSHLVSVD